MKKAKYTALCGMAAALTVVLMAATTILPVLMYVLPIITGIIVLLTSLVAGKKYAFGVYAASSILLIVLITDKESALTYILFFGYYPLIRDALDRLPKVLSWALKLVLFNICAVLIGVISVYVFGISGEEYSEFGRWTVPVLLAMSNLVFLLYDTALKKNGILLELLADKINKTIK
ncbi:MAG: hypothetical protein J6Q83_08315 [Clostridia bacterium]|nr:hypothetical protein [Clostridia bacterium]